MTRKQQALFVAENNLLRLKLSEYDLTQYYHRKMDLSQHDIPYLMVLEKEFIDTIRPVQALQTGYTRELFKATQIPEVGDKCIVTFYSDVEPATITHVSKSGHKIDFQFDKAELNQNWKPDQSVGGFAAHTKNNDEQQWTITRDEDGKRGSAFRGKDGIYRYQRSLKVTIGSYYKHYDYNF